MKKISPFFILVAIVSVGFFMRVWRVGEIPPSLSWDEASIGYNAYSILKTGRDEHGRLLPFDAFAAFGDYKPPLAIYATVPFVAVFGLTETAVRLPSVLAGVLAVFLTYFLVRELTKNKTLSLLTSFLLAVSPWNINLSRAMFEANIAVALLLLGSVLLLRARGSPKMFFVAFVPFIAAVYTFNSARIFAPLLLVILLWYCWESVRKHKREVITGALVGSLVFLPLLPYLVSRESRLRFAEVNIFTDSSVVTKSNERIAVDGGAWWAKILHNRRLGYARSYLIHFFDNLEPQFLFTRGDGNPKFSIQDVGQMYLIELPFFVIGFFGLFKKNRALAWLVLFWIVAAIAPAATARETPHALRIENSLPMWQLVIASGILSAVESMGKMKRTLLLIGIIVLYIANVSFYVHNYYNHYAAEYSGEWQWGYREAIRAISQIKDKYTRVVMDDTIGRPYIYVLFYQRYDPQKFQRVANWSTDAAGFFHINNLDAYQFTDTPPSFAGGVLYVLRPSFVPGNARVLTTIRLLNGSPVLVIFDIPASSEKL